MFVRSAFPVNLTKFFSFSVFNQASICQSSRNNFWCAEGRWSVKESYEGIRYKTQKCPLKSLYGLLCPSFPQPPSTLGLAYMVTWLIHTKTRLKIINLCTPQSTSTARADRVPYTACDVIIVKHRWNSTCAGRRDFSNHTQMSAIQSKRREKNAKKLCNLEQMILRGKSRFLHYPPVHFLPNNFGSSRGLGFRENASQPNKTWTWIEDLRFWCVRLWDRLILLLAELKVYMCKRNAWEKNDIRLSKKFS